MRAGNVFALVLAPCGLSLLLPQAQVIMGGNVWPNDRQQPSVKPVHPCDSSGAPPHIHRPPTVHLQLPAQSPLRLPNGGTSSSERGPSS